MNKRYLPDIAEPHLANVIEAAARYMSEGG